MAEPEEYHHISNGPLSIARHCGGVKINGHYYVYIAAEDKLVREDVHRRRVREDKAAAKAERKRWQQMADEMQGSLQYGDERTA